jgi:hypothetical protein
MNNISKPFYICENCGTEIILVYKKKPILDIRCGNCFELMVEKK